MQTIQYSGKRDSNPQPLRWQRNTLPLSYSRLFFYSEKKDKEDCVYPVSLARFLYKGRDTNACAKGSFPFEKITPVSLVGIPSKHLSLIPLAARDKGRDTKFPLKAQKALFYAKKGRDTNSFAYKRKENNSFPVSLAPFLYKGQGKRYQVSLACAKTSFAFEKITPVSLARFLYKGQCMRKNLFS